jgi:hemerythrin superfamily protein
LLTFRPDVLNSGWHQSCYSFPSHVTHHEVFALDGIDLLVQHHRELEISLGLLLNEQDKGKQATLFKEAADLLAAHVALEEKVFYPAVSAAKTEDILLESLEEHLSLKRLLADLIALSPQDEHFSPKVHVLKEQAEHHHKEEEHHLFPKVRKLFDESEISELGDRMLKWMDEMSRGEPRFTILNETDQAAALP